MEVALVIVKLIGVKELRCATDLLWNTFIRVATSYNMRTPRVGKHLILQPRILRKVPRQNRTPRNSPKCPPVPKCPSRPMRVQTRPDFVERGGESGQRRRTHGSSKKKTRARRRRWIGGDSVCCFRTCSSWLRTVRSSLVLTWHHDVCEFMG